MAEGEIASEHDYTTQFPLKDWGDGGKHKEADQIKQYPDSEVQSSDILLDYILPRLKTTL